MRFSILNNRSKFELRKIMKALRSGLRERSVKSTQNQLHFWFQRTVENNEICPLEFKVGKDHFQDIKDTFTLWEQLILRELLEEKLIQSSLLSQLFEVITNLPQGQIDMDEWIRTNQLRAKSANRICLH